MCPPNKTRGPASAVGKPSKKSFIAKRIVILIAYLSIGLFDHPMIAQVNENHEHDPHHEHAANEIGAGNLLSYLVNEREVAYGLHVHYSRSVKDTWFEYGIGYEEIFAEHKHRALGVVGSYRPIPPLVLSVSPGILFPNQEHAGVRFVFHMEAAFEIEIGPVHLGPLLGFATTFEELHIGAGLHLGFSF